MALSFVLAPSAFAQQPQPWKPEVKFLKFGVATAGGDWFRAGAKFTTMIPEVLPGVSANTLMGGGVVNVTKVGKGEAQLAFASTPYPENGYEGKGDYKEPFKNLRLIASNLGKPIVVALFVLKDSPIKSMADLKGKRIVPGDRGWATTVLAEAMMAGRVCRRTGSRPRAGSSATPRSPTARRRSRTGTSTRSSSRPR